MRHVIQISSYKGGCFALCNDHTIWQRETDENWEQLPPIPQDGVANTLPAVDDDPEIEADQGDLSIDSFEGVMTRIGKMNPNWQRTHYSYDERVKFAQNKDQLTSMSSKDWWTLTVWFHVTERPNENLYRAKLLGKFLENPGAELDKAREFSRSHKERFEKLLVRMQTKAGVRKPAEPKPRHSRPAADKPVDPVDAKNLFNEFKQKYGPSEQQMDRPEGRDDSSVEATHGVVAD